MSDDPGGPDISGVLSNMLLLTAGAGMAHAGLHTILASANAFSTHVLGVAAKAAAPPAEPPVRAAPEPAPSRQASAAADVQMTGPGAHWGPPVVT